jgi:cell wall-associated NlpC family hydrolase
MRRARGRRGLTGERARRLGLLLALAVAAGCATPVTSRPPGPSLAIPTSSELRILRTELVRLARGQLGVPYAWGGADPRGFDCSGLVMYVYGALGVRLPHTAEQQFRYGAEVSRVELEPGDVVFFDRLRHNGIYIGQGRFVHATQSGDVVRVSSLDERWFRTRWVGARRLLDLGPR